VGWQYLHEALKELYIVPKKISGGRKKRNRKKSILFVLWRYQINFGGVVWFYVMFSMLLWCLSKVFVIGGIMCGA